MKQWKEQKLGSYVFFTLEIGVTLIIYIEPAEQEEGADLWMVRIGGQWGRALKRMFTTKRIAQIEGLKFARKILSQALSEVDLQEQVLLKEDEIKEKFGTIV